MKVDLAVLHASVNHLFQLLLSLCEKKKKKKMQFLSTLGRLMVYGMILVKANIQNDKETGNSKKTA